MDRIRSTPFLISVAIHAAFFLSLKSDNDGGVDGGNGTKKSDYVGFDTSSIIDKNDNGSGVKDCPDWFGGIGIIHDFYGEKILTVHAGYPAYRAGLKEGDIIVSDGRAIKGKVGTKVTVTVMRGDQKISFTMIREKICTDGG